MVAASVRYTFISLGLVIGLLLVVGGVLFGWVILPAAVNNEIKKASPLENNTATWRRWQGDSVRAHLRIHIFNITNPEGLVKGEKLNVQEVGPYVYSISQKKVKVRTEGDNSLAYKVKTTYFFDPDKSKGTEDDVVSVPNLPLIFTAHAGYVGGNIANHSTQRLIEKLTSTDGGNEKLVKESVKVGELLFSGWDIPYHYSRLTGILSVGNLFKDVNGLKYGIYRRKNGTTGKKFVINPGWTSTAQLGEILRWDGHKELHWWFSQDEHNKSDKHHCNKINGSDASIFPPFLTKDRILHIFVPETCRSLPLVFDSEIKVKKNPAYKYTVPSDVLADPAINTDNACYCQKQNPAVAHYCGAGFTRLFPCKNGLPWVSSHPHFLYGGSDLFGPTNISLGNKSEHLTYLIIEPHTGIPLGASIRFQLNVEIQKLNLPIFRELNFENVTDRRSIIAPVMWIEENFELSNSSLDQLYDTVIAPERGLRSARWLFVAVGTCLTIISGVYLGRAFR